MTRAVTSTRVARRFLKIATEKDEPISLTPLQLIKLTYLAHGWAFPRLNRLLVDEPVEAWRYGPVFPLLYDVLKLWGRDPVSYVPKHYKEKYFEEKGVNVRLKKKETRLIRDVFETYKKYSGPELIQLTHENKAPWSWSFPFFREIKPDVICKHYAELAKNGRSV